MKKYRMLAEINRKQIFGEEIPQEDKQSFVSVCLNEVNGKTEIASFKQRMKVDPETDCMYPNYFLPPKNFVGNKAEKLRLVQGYLPKTYILYANHYELEILRLLCMTAHDDPAVAQMTSGTADRLRHTCFGNSCTKGECKAAGISVLRFLTAAQPYDSEWISKLLEPLGEAFLSFGGGQAAVQKDIPMSYLLMAFTEINSSFTQELIRQKKDWLLELLRRGWITGRLSNGRISEGDTYNLMGKYIIRNALATLPELADIGKCRIYVSEEDERCYCEV